MHQAVLGPNIVPAYLQPPVRGGNLNFPEILEQLASIMTVVDSWIVQIKASSFTEPIRNLLEDFALELTLNMSEVESYKFNLGTLPEFYRARVARGNRLLYAHKHKFMNIKREHGDLVERLAVPSRAEDEDEATKVEESPEKKMKGSQPEEVLEEFVVTPPD